MDKIARGGGCKLGPIYSTLHICGLRARWIRFDRTRKGWHIVILLDTSLQEAEAVALEVIMGSDRRRANLDLMRILAVRKNATSPFWKKRTRLLYRSKLESIWTVRKRAAKTAVTADSG